MRTTRTHEEAANRRRDAKAHARRSAGEATRERLLTLTLLTERRLELAYALRGLHTALVPAAAGSRRQP